MVVYPKYFNEDFAHYRDVQTVKLFDFFTRLLITYIARTDRVSIFGDYFDVQREKISLYALVAA
jgi:hypothetical protein